MALRRTSLVLSLGNIVYHTAKLMKTKPAKKSGWQNKVYHLTLDGPLNDHSSAHKVWFQLHLWIAHSLKTSGVNCFLKSSHIFHKVLQIQQLLYICSPESEKWHSASSSSWNINSLLCSYFARRIWFFFLLLLNLGGFALFCSILLVLFFFFPFLLAPFLTHKPVPANYKCCVAKFWLYT